MGTYEARPGAGAADYTNPSADYPPGNHQGDGPTGTLTSETFTIGGMDENQVRPFFALDYAIFECGCFVGENLRAVVPTSKHRVQRFSAVR